MFGIAAITVLCTAGVAFYVRFLVALCGEWRRGRIFYLMRIRPAASEVAVIRPKRKKATTVRAA